MLITHKFILVYYFDYNTFIYDIFPENKLSFQLTYKLESQQNLNSMFSKTQGLGKV